MTPQWRRRLAYGSNATVVTFASAAILVMLYLGALQTRVQWDLTAEGRHTLTPDMRAKLALLDADGETVTITAFTAQRGKQDASFKNRTIKNLLADLGAHSQVLDWRLIDFDRERLTAERLGVTEYSHVVVQRGQARVDIKARDLFRSSGPKDQRRTNFLGEGAFARAFSQLHTPKRRVVYVLQGHGERGADDRGPNGLSDLTDALDVERYDVEPLDLLATSNDGGIPVVPDDAAVVLIAGPTASLSSHETDALITHMGRGGGLIVGQDPGSETLQILTRLNVGIPSGVASDTRVVFPFWDRPIPVVRNHPLTESLRNAGLVPVLSHIAPINVGEPMPGLQVAPLLSTSRKGWVERGGELKEGAPVYDEGIDGKGPVSLAVAIQIRPGTEWVSAGNPAARVVVFGDSDFMANGLFTDGPGNATLVLESVHWAAGSDARVSSVGARRHKVRRLAISSEQLVTVRWLSLAFLPSLIGLMGLCVRWSRRGR